MKNYRHGDLALIGIKELPQGLERAETKVIMAGSHGNAHSIDNGDIYFENSGEYIFGYLAAKNTSLFHPEHGEGKGKLKETRIEDGFYELRRQQEKTHEGMKIVED